MWRSFLARPHPLLSHLRRPSRCSAAAVVGAHPRAYASGTAEAEGAKSSRRHLYVVLDEMKSGHGIYRLDVDDLDGGDADAVTGMDSPGRASQLQTMPPCPLPEPVLRLGNTSVGSRATFASVGSKIVIIGNTHQANSSSPIRQGSDSTVVFVYDTNMGKLDMAEPPPPSFHLNRFGYHAVAVGNKLYHLHAAGAQTHYLCEQQAVEFAGGYNTEKDDTTMLDMRGQIMEWTWKTGPSHSGTATGVHNDLTQVRSYAVHPDGRTIFISYGYKAGVDSTFTFSLDTDQHGTQHRGDWNMPFVGRANYDAHLDAWVGIQKVYHNTPEWMERWYLYSCDVPNLAMVDHGDGPPKPMSAPEWRMCKEELTFVKGTSASGRALVHTGRGRFCLVEATPVVPLDQEGANKPSQCNRCTMYRGNEHLLHVTMFCAKHGKDGQLVIAPCRPGRSYLVPNYVEDATQNPPIAFWM